MADWFAVLGIARVVIVLQTFIAFEHTDVALMVLQQMTYLCQTTLQFYTLLARGAFKVLSLIHI